MKKVMATILSLMLIMVITLPVVAFKTIDAKGIKLDKSKITLDVGQTYKLKVTFTPVNTTKKNLTYVTSNKKIATIDTTGKIKAISEGNAVITVFTYNKKIYAKCNVAVTAPFKYPVKTSKKIVVLKWVDGNINTNFDNFGKTEFAKEREKRTGIKAKYVIANSTEAIQILMASREYCDIYDFAIKDYPGQDVGMYKDKLILTLNELKGYCPNYFSFLSKNPQIDKMVKSTEGLYYSFPSINIDPQSTYGPMVRKDWLDSIGMDIPETVDDWYEMLKAFRDKKKAVAPLTLSYPSELFWTSRWLVCAFGTSNTYLLKGGKVVYGPMQPEYKTYLQTISKWFAENLIDKDYVSLNRTICNNRVYAGEAGAVANVLAYLGLYNDEGKKRDPKFNLVPTPIIVMHKGDKPMLGQRDDVYNPGGVAMTISSTSKNKELAARFIDWNYSAEGTLLCNYGIEGTTYTVSKDGKKRYTDLMYKSPDGWSLSQMEAKWCGGYANAYVRDYGLHLTKIPPQYYDLYSKAYDIWRSPNYDKYYALPMALLGLPSTDVAESNSISKDLETEMREFGVKVLLGETPINDSTFGQFVDNLKRIGVEKVLKTYNSGYEIYNKR